MNKQDEMTFAKELWKIILEIEDMVRTYYQRHAEEEIYDLQDDDPAIPF
ncbi:MAG: hypothetical protein AB1568_17535 [Thermodesulfobacteriota bacterium]